MLHSRKAITLTEVLVVVLIIAILAALVYPLFGRSREEARQAGCITDLKQIYTAVCAYAGDNDGVQSLATLSANTLSLHPYVKSKEIYFCPDFPKPFRAINIGSSYTWNFIHPASTDSRIPEEDRRLGDRQIQEMAASLEKKGNNYALLTCFWHDELFYYPSEKKYDSALQGAMVIELRENGSVYRGRMPYPRGMTLKLFQGLLDVQGGSKS